MKKKAVIDIGSLKVKVAIFDMSERSLVQASSHLTLLGKGIEDTNEITFDSLEKLDNALAATSNDLAQLEDLDVSIIGTEALRRAKNINAVEKIIEKKFPHHKLEIVEQEKEAELFFTAVSREFPDEEITAMDVGGGSVQLIKGRYDKKTQKVFIKEKHNLKTGTYSLQQKYSPSNFEISKKFNDASREVAQSYAEISHKSPILVFGSTCMQDFIVSTGVQANVEDKYNNHSIFVNRETISLLLEELKLIQPDSRNHYYPDGDYFMYGADYLLMNVLAAVDRIHPVKIYPSNINSSYAFI